jgi:RND family efflux transporter MFP subunit
MSTNRNENHIELGVDGLTARTEQKQVYFLPGDSFVKSYFSLKEIKSFLERSIGKENWPAAQLYRFRTESFVSYKNTWIPLFRGYPRLGPVTPKDLEQARIAKDQATKGISTTDSVSAENYRSAEIAYDTAKLATEQAKINLENRQKQVGLSNGDTNTNSASAADTAANTCDTIINGLNNSLGLDDVSLGYLSYSSDLSALDTDVLRQAKTAYRSASAANEAYKLRTFADATSQVKEAISLATKTKTLSDLSKRVLEKTPSLTGGSLNVLIGTVTGYQSQANGALTQANGAKQLLENTDLGNDSSLSLLEKGYELAQKQEEAAKQNLNAIKAGQSGQKDQAGFGAQSATTQYEGLKIKLDSQLAVAKSQLDMAQLQYSTAGVALQGLYDSHLAISPISGVVTQKQVDNGTTVSPGQILASVSRTDQVKIQFFADEDSLKYLAPGQAVEILGNDGQSAPGKIFNLTPQADQVSKKFLVEVKPDSATSTQLTAGTVVNVAVSLKKVATIQKAIILPLSAIEISQNNNYIFTINNGVASKTPIQIIKVDGETAQVKFEGDDKTLIIVEGNKLVSEGDPVKTE